MYYLDDLLMLLIAYYLYLVLTTFYFLRMTYNLLLTFASNTWQEPPLGTKPKTFKSRCPVTVSSRQSKPGEGWANMLTSTGTQYDYYY